MMERNFASSLRSYCDQMIQFALLILITLFWRLVLLITVIFKSR